MSETHDGNEPREGENLTFADDITVGDLVHYDREPGGSLVIRRLREWEVSSFEGKMYRVEPGAKPNQLQLRGITKDQTPP